MRNFSCSAHTVTWKSSGVKPKKLSAAPSAKNTNGRFFIARMSIHVEGFNSSGRFLRPGIGPPKTKTKAAKKAKTAENILAPTKKPNVILSLLKISGKISPP